ncbi:MULTISPECIES: VWA domain-containing protein [Metabacillus]|jgi:Ca-activated chloride channel homolog|uniref:VWA domain-containing protein n=1 Tax=Metabacillus rhizolycopersici TaxID=2875709 RepID=A0ABS7UT10_9BACI|nr:MULTISPECIES: VWA domain-containing protein [Metabacillus]MBZ5751184.1 VWA domain-containing protein [Metabacillus rhizolycopersici]MCM3655051.1 VWA domain-containing protein [Metabacillus litoralis]
MAKGHLKQILLITDGCSNHGEDPIAMAALANEQGITVNVIGVVDENAIDQEAIQEVEEIAMSGGGVHQIVYAKQLSQTVQMVTRKAMTQTLQGVVNKELQQILGTHTSMEELPPEKRGEVMEVVDELGETVSLEILILVDTSASMKPKLPTVKEALLDLSISLNSRIGANQFSVSVFPGKRDDVEQVLDWTPKLESLSSIFSKLSTGGITPTGPAIKDAIQHFKKKRSLRSLLRNEEEYYDESGM